MGACTACRYSSHCRRHRKIRLLHRDKLQKELWLNEHVLHHYRPPRMSAGMCIKSIFHWTNETVNIWSHLLGFIYFSYLQLERNFRSLPALRASALEHAVVTTSLLGAQTCMLFSAAFHIFGCQSALQRKKFLRLDLFGISTGILSMYVTGIYTSFYCFEDQLYQYLGVLLLLFVITGMVPFRQKSFEKKVIGSRIGWLHLIYSAVILFGAAPTIHWVALHGGLSNQHVLEWLPNVLVVYTLTAAAFFFYVSMFPERCRPGAFDLVGCSHQWWHLFILAAMAWWQESSIRLLRHYHSYGNFCARLGDQLDLPTEHHSIPFNGSRTEL